MRISDWSSDVCSSDLRPADRAGSGAPHRPVDRGRTAPPRVGARGVAMSARSNVAAMTDALVHLERRADGVAVVRLDNGKVNALSTALLAQLTAVAEQLQDDPPGAVVITGGDRLFAAGAEISEFLSPEAPGEVVTHAEAERIGQHFLRALNAVADIPRATIAAISGFALGGGCELALACDFRIASEKAKLGQPEILLGIIPGGGGTQRLARLVGPDRKSTRLNSSH